MSDTVLLQWQDDVATLTLNRPEKLNAFNAELKAGLLAALGDLKRERPKVLVITGAGRAFAAGQDLEDRRNASNVDLGASIAEFYAPLVTGLASLPSVTVARVPGVAAGAGASLALSCDIVIASDEAKFVFPFGKIGLVPDGAITRTLPRLVGTARAKAILLLGAPVSATEAASVGMIWQAVPAADLDECVAACVDGLSSQSAAALAATVEMLREPSPDLAEHFHREARHQARLGKSEYYQDSVTSFLNRTRHSS